MYEIVLSTLYMGFWGENIVATSTEIDRVYKDRREKWKRQCMKMTGHESRKMGLRGFKCWRKREPLFRFMLRTGAEG